LGGGASSSASTSAKPSAGFTGATAGYEGRLA
jgi:hypothetical protein